MHETAPSLRVEPHAGHFVGAAAAAPAPLAVGAGGGAEAGLDLDPRLLEDHLRQADEQADQQAQRGEAPRRRAPQFRERLVAEQPRERGLEAEVDEAAEDAARGAAEGTLEQLAQGG